MKPELATVRGVLDKVAKQVDDVPEYRLYFAVFAQTARDFVSDPIRAGVKQKDEAREYLKGDLPHLSAIGIDPDWVRMLFKKAGVEL